MPTTSYRHTPGTRDFNAYHELMGLFASATLEPATPIGRCVNSLLFVPELMSHCIWLFMDGGGSEGAQQAYITETSLPLPLQATALCNVADPTLSGRHLRMCMQRMRPVPGTECEMLRVLHTAGAKLLLAMPNPRYIWKQMQSHEASAEAFAHLLPLVYDDDDVDPRAVMEIVGGDRWLALFLFRVTRDERFAKYVHQTTAVNSLVKEKLKKRRQAEDARAKLVKLSETIRRLEAEDREIEETETLLLHSTGRRGTSDSVTAFHSHVYHRVLGDTDLTGARPQAQKAKRMKIE